MAREARQTERSGGQKGRGWGGEGIFARPRFPSPPNFVPTKLARRFNKFNNLLCVEYSSGQRISFLFQPSAIQVVHIELDKNPYLPVLMNFRRSNNILLF